jgi:hypothetical protein
MDQLQVQKPLDELPLRWQLLAAVEPEDVAASAQELLQELFDRIPDFEQLQRRLQKEGLTQKVEQRELLWAISLSQHNMFRDWSCRNYPTSCFTIPPVVFGEEVLVRAHHRLAKYLILMEKKELVSKSLSEAIISLYRFIGLAKKQKSEAWIESKLSLREQDPFARWVIHSNGLNRRARDGRLSLNWPLLEPATREWIELLQEFKRYQRHTQKATRPPGKTKRST